MDYPINPSLLIAAPMLQDYFVDKDTGLPLAAGIVTLYTDPSMGQLKPWYEQIGTTPPYNNYVQLPNPMTLSAVGTIQDTSGNDVIPFFYPYDIKKPTPSFQSYFITVQNSDLELQFTRYNFPFVASGGVVPGVTANTNENILINNGFWRSAGPGSNTPFNPNPIMMANPQIVVGGVSLYNMTLAPSQHDGYTMPDIMYFKNTIDSTEMISFNTFAAPSSQPVFPDNVLMMDITPELYMTINCTGFGTETVRYVQIPLSLHIKSLSGFPGGTFTIQAMNNTGSSATNITAAIFQYTGTGAPSQPVPTRQQILLGTAWNKSQINLPIPTAQNITTGAGGDDALYLQIGFPTGQNFSINIALPEFYLGSPPSTNSFQTYDQVNAIASSPRTGDVRTSLNSFSPFGWVPANDGTIGSPGSGATSRNNADTWPLYNLIYTSVLNIFAPVTGGRTAPGNTTAAAYADFSSNKPMALTKMLGRALIGYPSAISVTSYTLTAPSWNSGDPGYFTMTDNGLLYEGSPVYFTGTMPSGSNMTAGMVYYAVPAFDGTENQFQFADTYANAIAGNPISGTGAGTGGSNMVVNFAFGSYFGQDEHMQLPEELALHNHDALLRQVTSANGFQPGVNAPMPNTLNAGVINTVLIGNTGNSNLFNIVQPSTYVNVFLKL